MTLSNRSSIKTDMPGEIQTGDILPVAAIRQSRLVEDSLEYTDPIPSFGFITLYLFPAPGAVLSMKQLDVFIGAVDGVGVTTHSVMVASGYFTTALEGASTRGEDIWFYCGHWISADSGQYPPDAVSQRLALNSLMADQVTPVAFSYGNFTAVTQFSNLFIYMVYEEWGEWV